MNTAGSVISKLNVRKGMMQADVTAKTDSPHLEYLVPTRGLLGYRSEFINDTQRRGHHGAALC